VKPRINEGGLVSIELNQEISDYVTIKLYANEDQVIINKTDVSTNLVVQDGQTIIIGGLINEKISASNTGIPWLNKIPILGYLFGNTSNDSTQTEIVILLTPHVMKSIQDASDVTSEYTDRLNKVGLERPNIKTPVEKNVGKKGPEDKTVDKSDKK
jgi:general secretion pathway protein D